MQKDPKNGSFSQRMPRIAGLLLFFFSLAAAARTGAEDSFGPNLWDPNHRIEKPDLTTIRSLNFLTTDDYPPFHFALSNELNSLGGFDIDLARAICQELKLIEPKLTCTIQARKWEILTDTLEADPADVLLAAIPINAQTRAKFAFTTPYYKTPARFVTRLSTPLADVTPEGLAGKKIGVLEKTAHRAYLEQFFPQAALTAFPTKDATREALQHGEIDALFDDGISLALWLNGTEARNCCAFAGGPFLDSRFFNEGVGLAIKKDNLNLRQALDYALARLAAKGMIDELYLKYFPIGFY
jgi:polar amino acid transport system substrate-binding protein